jgi:hypothetical protein
MYVRFDCSIIFDMTKKKRKLKVQRDKQRSTKHTYKTKDRIARTPLKAGVNSGVPER